MSRTRKVAHEHGPKGQARVYWDRDWEEYLVTFTTTDGRCNPAADYHTDEKGDAIDTARLMVQEG